MNRHLLTLTIASLTGVAAVALCTGTAAASTPGSLTLQTLTSLHGSIRSVGSTQDTFELKLTITNNTDQNWTFDPQDSHSGDDSHTHWEQRPQTTLDAKQSEVISTETDDPAALDTQVTFKMANGEYASVELTDWLNSNNHFEFSGVAKTAPPYQYNMTHSTNFPTDDAWTPTDSIQTGDHISASMTISAAS